MSSLVLQPLPNKVVISEFYIKCMRDENLNKIFRVNCPLFNYEGCMKGTCHISIVGANFRHEEHDIANRIPGTFSV